MKTKAQVQSQIFIYIIAIVVVGLILLFGYNAVKNFGERAEEVALIQFEKDILSTFHTISTSYGKVEIKKVEIPGGFDTVCFVDLDIPSGDLLTHDNIDYPIVTENVKSDTGKNLFLAGGLEIESYDVGNIDIRIADGTPSNFICFKEKQGRVEFKLFGKGDYVLVSTAD